MVEQPATPGQALRHAYAVVRRHATTYRDSAAALAAKIGNDERARRTASVHRWYAAGLDAAARDIADMLGTDESDLADEFETARSLRDGMSAADVIAAELERRHRLAIEDDPADTAQALAAAVGAHYELTPRPAPTGDTHRTCPRCGSTEWLSISLDTGFSRRAQCVPCGTVHPGVLGPGWKAGG